MSVTTLLRVSTEGKGGRCDAKCHDATSPDCDCVCGGVNHGVGLHQAVANTRDALDSLVEQYAAAHDLDRAQFAVNVAPAVVQGTLFR